MKFVGLFIAGLFSISAHAAEIHLKSGDSVFVRPNVETYVTCEGTSNGNGCASKIQSLVSKMEYCQKSSSTSFCLQNLWPKFKQENSNCVAEAFETCTKYCERSSSSNYCYNYCQ